MSWRMERINQMLKNVLSQIFLKELEIPAGVLVTITQVKTSKDLTQAKIFISVLPDEKSDFFLSFLEKRKNFFSSLLAKKITLKKIPQLNFVKERGFQKAQKIEEILYKLKQKRK